MFKPCTLSIMLSDRETDLLFDSDLSFVLKKQTNWVDQKNLLWTKNNNNLVWFGGGNEFHAKRICCVRQREKSYLSAAFASSYIQGYYTAMFKAARPLKLWTREQLFSGGGGWHYSFPFPGQTFPAASRNQTDTFLVTSVLLIPAYLLYVQWSSCLNRWLHKNRTDDGSAAASL